MVALIVTIDDVANRLRHPRPGRSILFVGAGFSVGAKNQSGDDVPLARAFSRKLATEIGLGVDVPLTVSSQRYNQRFNDPSAFLNLIKKTFTVSSISIDQSKILEYPWKRIYTTNYDDLIEHVVFPRGILPRSFTRDKLPMRVEAMDERQIVHLNGFVGSVDRNTVVEDFLLTLTSYFESNLFDSPWAATLRSDFLLADSIIFAGYSMYDPDISNLIGRNPDIRKKISVIQHVGLSKDDEEYLSEFGTVFKIGNSGFANIVEGVLKDGKPEIKVGGSENFKEIHLPSSSDFDEITDRDIDALLVRGVYDREKYLSSVIKGGRSYLVYRREALKIADELNKSGGMAVIHCDFGNGKTLFVEQIMSHMLLKGFRIFILERRTDNFSYDVEFFSNLSEKYVLVIEEIIANEDAVSILSEQLSDARMILTSRTSAFDLKEAEIRNIVDARALVFSVDKLRDTDIDSAIEILDKGGYWGKISGVHSKKEKRRYISDKCKSELSSLLLGLVNSQYLDERLRSAFARRSYDLSAPERSIVLALCLNTVEMIPSLEFLSELMGVDLFGTSKVFSDSFVRDFFAVDTTGVRARSPIMSEYILKNVISDDLKTDVVFSALRVSSNKYNRAKRYRELNSKLLQFSFVENIIQNGNNKYERIQDYYDRAGQLGYKDFSPHYWLQYAIAARSFHDYKSADRYFSQTRKIIERKADFYTYKVDNSYAQFLLESRSDTEFWSDFFDAFVEASTLAFNQTKHKRTGLYPYKVATLFLNFFEIRAGRLTRSQRERAIEMLKQWEVQIRDTENRVRGKKVLAGAKRSVSSSLDYLIAMTK